MRVSALSLLIFANLYPATWLLPVASAERVPWTTSRIQGSPDPPRPYAVRRVFAGLQFEQPVELVPLANTGRYLLLEVGGKVYTFEDDQNCTRADLAFDVSDRIDNFSRAYGIGVHPNFMENRQVFICYAGNPVARPDGTRLSRFTMTEDERPRIDPASEEILLTWPSGGHNGCAIRFDRNGYLYFSAGDGARPYPPDEYDVGQDLSDLRATICRIDVNHRDPGLNYAIPPDNPFRELEHARPEVWAYGFRNPWRFSIDPKTDRLMCGDVGWELWEMIHLVGRGTNHGWSIFEGPQPIRGDIAPGPTPVRKPLVAYPHTDGLSVTGGFTYGGNRFPDLAGTYFYGDYVTGLLWGLQLDGSQVRSNEVLAETGLAIITFTESRQKEPLVLSYNGGIYELIENPVSGQSTAFPMKLSQTGLFASTAELTTAPGVYPYQVIAQAWQDGATSDYVVAVPGEESITTGRRKRNWQYPIDTVFARTISMNVVTHGTAQPRRIETQILHYDGLSWQPYCYVWNDAQTDADLLGTAGAESTLIVPSATGTTRELHWRHHSRSECRACHINQTGGAVAFSYENLTESSLVDPDQNQLGLDQTGVFAELKILDKQAPSGWGIQRMVNPYDASQSLESRARSYLVANCAHCHCRGGGGTVALDLEYGNATSDINAIDFPATQGLFGIPDGRVIASGNPYRSVLYYRMATSGNGHMPKVWTRDNDDAGLRLIHDWIASLAPASKEAAEAELKVDQNLDTASALKLFHGLLVSGQTKSPSMSESALQSASPLTIGLFERFLPPEKRIQRLGVNVDSTAILAMPGDATAGRDRFLNSSLLQCRSCHRAEGQGQMVGPDLDRIATKRSKADLLESILEPAKKIEPEYVSHSVVTVDGRVITGLKIEQDQATITLRVADGKTHCIPRDDVEQLSIQSTSLMPTGLAAEMTASELADLLAYLSSLK